MRLSSEAEIYLDSASETLINSGVEEYKNTFGLCFVPGSWHRAHKTLGISEVLQAIKMSSVMFSKPLLTTPEFIVMKSLWRAPR